MRTRTMAIIAVLLLLLVLVSGCIGPGDCSFRTAGNKNILEGSTIKECVDACHSLGILWRTEVEGIEPDRVRCNCYMC